MCGNFENMSQSVGIVVPTMGKRIEYLTECLQSIRASGNVLIYIVSPEMQIIRDSIDSNLYDGLIPDPLVGLSAAIDLGIRSFPDHITYVSWLGDDDKLTKDSTEICLSELSSNRNVIMVYGACQYIDSKSNVFWTNSSGRFAIWLMRFGPQLVSQPGTLFRRDAYNALGGLDVNLKWAFDLDLFIRIMAAGTINFTPHVLAQFRWHEGSLSVGARQGSVREASFVRRKYLHRSIRLISILWEVPMRYLILHAAKFVNLKTRAKSS